jgi:hypothetical protein
MPDFSHERLCHEFYYFVSKWLILKRHCASDQYENNYLPTVLKLIQIKNSKCIFNVFSFCLTFLFLKHKIAKKIVMKRNLYSFIYFSYSMVILLTYLMMNFNEKKKNW